MITYYVACSLDNFIAGPNGELDWLPQAAPEGEDFGYHAFYDTQDIVVMGRKTWEICRDFGDWPYKGKPSFVFTKQKGLKPLADEAFTEFDAAYWREQSKAKKIYLNGGGEIARLFAEQGLLDRLEMTLVPVILGKGLPLFAPGTPRIRFKLDSSKPLALGLVTNSYSVEKP